MTPKNIVAVRETDFPRLKLLKRGKVRNIYDLGNELLIVSTDRISAFDVVMNDPIPEKGIALNTLSAYWMRILAPIVPNHIISIDPNDYPPECRPYLEQLKGRSMLVEKADPLLFECIVRGYISGCGWTEYQEKQSICGIPLSDGLVESQELPGPIFTPFTKAEHGLHDENITFDKAKEILGAEIANHVRRFSLDLYNNARHIARDRGIIIADTKFEFGLKNGELLLIDEVLTPDSSRFWPVDGYKPGGPQPSYDKQFLRDWLLAQNWNMQAPPPALPPDIIAKTKAKYDEALKRLTNKIN